MLLARVDKNTDTNDININPADGHHNNDNHVTKRQQRRRYHQQQHQQQEQYNNNTNTTNPTNATNTTDNNHMPCLLAWKSDRASPAVSPTEKATGRPCDAARA